MFVPLQVIHTPRAHIHSHFGHSRLRLGWDWLAGMAITQQAARMAAQLHEAAEEIARLAARRSAEAEGQQARPVPGKGQLDEACPSAMSSLITEGLGDGPITVVRLTGVAPATSRKPTTARMAGIAVPVLQACDDGTAVGHL